MRHNTQHSALKTLFIFFIIHFLLIILISCSQVSVQPRNYFLLEYKSAKEDASLKSNNPHNFSVRVVDTEVSGTYNRRQIVIKTSENQIRYDSDNLWADRLPKTLADLIFQRVNTYNAFQRVTRDYAQQTQFEITSNVNALEYLKYGNIYAARLSIVLSLRKTSDNVVVFQTTSDRIRQTFINDTEMFVQTINDLLMEEVDNFLRRINENIDHIEAGEEWGASHRQAITESERDADRLSESIADEGLVSIVGRLFIPSLTEPELEPVFTIHNSEGQYEGSYQMGSEVHLRPDTYTVTLGSGTASQKITETIEIKPRYKETLIPNAGWLTVNIIDENRSQIDRSYELFDMETTESYGFGYGVQEGVGQRLNTWILKPGLYKVVLNNNPFHTYVDFATIEINKGELSRLTIVVGEAPGYNLVGAGRLIHDDAHVGDRKLKLTITNHLNASFNSKNDKEDKKNSYSLNITEQLDSRLVYDTYPVHYTMKSLIEVGVFTDNETDLKVQQDKFDLRNTLIYYFYKNLGLYARADIATHLFEESVKLDSVSTFIVVPLKGSEYEIETDKFRTKPSLYPMTLKEGIGINYRILNKNRANLNLRAGFGLRQEFNQDVFSLDREPTQVIALGDSFYVIPGREFYQEQDNLYQRGTEISANGNFQILKNLNYTMTADYLIPFDKKETAIFEMENIFNLRMFKYVSLDYRLDLSYDRNQQDYMIFDHSVFLRFTYIFVR